MAREVMDSVLTKTSRKMVAAKRNILLFMGNAPCHPENMKFSDFKVVFLTEKHYVKTASMIRNFKVKYWKRLLKFVISRIDDNRKASAIIQEVDVLKAISWIKAAWEEVSNQIVINCFRQCGFRNKAENGDVQTLDPEEDEEFANLVKELAIDVDPDDYVDYD